MSTRDIIILVEVAAVAILCWHIGYMWGVIKGRAEAYGRASEVIEEWAKGVSDDKYSTTD